MIKNYRKYISVSKMLMDRVSKILPSENFPLYSIYLPAVLEFLHG